MTEAVIVTIGLAVAVQLFLTARDGARGRTSPDLPVAAALILIGIMWYRLSQDDPLQVTLLSGLMVAAAATFGLWFNARLARSSADRQRLERKLDIRRAVAAEIDNDVQSARTLDWTERVLSINAAFEANSAYVPFVVPRKRDLYLAAVQERIEVLDDTQVETVVRYYALAADIELLKHQMTQPAYAALDLPRRRAIVADLLQLEERLMVVGLGALAELSDGRMRTKYDEAYRTAASAYEARYQSLNTDGKTDQGPSGRAAQV